MASEAEKLIKSGVWAQLPYGVPPAAVSQILEGGGSIDEAMRRLEQYEEEAEESGFELDFDIDDLYDKFETISQINGTAPFPVRDEAEVAAIVGENPELLDMAELVAATIENPDDLDEFEMLVGDIDAAMSTLSDDVVDEILVAMDSKDSFIGLEKVISDIETSIEETGARGTALSEWVGEINTVVNPTLVKEAEVYETTDPTIVGTAPIGGWEDPEDYVRSPWIDPGGDIGVTGDNKEIWDSMNPAQQKEILEVGWENYDWDNFWENRAIDFADADEVELPPAFNFNEYNSNWYNELSNIEKGKLEQYLFVEAGIDPDSNWMAYIEKGSSPDVELSMTMVNLWNQWRNQRDTGEIELSIDDAVSDAKESLEGFPGFPYDPTMVTGTGGTDDDDYDEDGKVIYDPRKHGSVTDSEGNKTPIPITGAFRWETWGNFPSGTEVGPPGQMGYNRQSIIEALEPYNDRELWSRYFNEAYAGNLKGTSGYLNYLQSGQWTTGAPNAPGGMPLSFVNWLASDIQKTLRGIGEAAGEDAEKAAATSLFAYMFSGMHDGELVNIDYSQSKLTPESLYTIVSGALQKSDVNEEWEPGQADRYIENAGYKNYANDIAETMPDVARYFGATSGINEKGEREWDEENKKWRGWEWPELPSFETLMRGYDVRYSNLDAKSAFGQAYLNDILNVQDNERDKFDNAFTKTNPQLMGGTYDDLRDSIFEDASIARFLNDEGWKEQNEKYQGLAASYIWPEGSDPEPERLYNMSGWEQDTGYYERYINNRNEEAEKLYDNAFELADFLDETAWLAQGEDFARTKTVTGDNKSEGELANEIYDRFNLNPYDPDGRRKYSLLQTFNPLLYKAGSDSYQAAETMIKQMALSSTLPVGANPYMRQLHRSMIDQRYNEWVNSNNNPNSFLKYWLESGRIISTRSSYDTKFEGDETDPKNYWNRYIADQWGDGQKATRRYRSTTSEQSNVVPTPELF